MERFIKVSIMLVSFLIAGTFEAEKALAYIDQKWSAIYDGNDSYDSGKKVVTDSNGNVYVTGVIGAATASGADPGQDILTIKYDTHGNKLWEAKYNGMANNIDVPTDITVDGQGNVYVTGTTYWNFITLKYNADGALQWAVEYDGVGHVDIATAITIDDNGYVYVTGQSAYKVGNGFDIVVVKYDSAGVFQWEAAYNDPYGNGDDWPVDIAVDKNGNVYVTGSIGGATHVGPEGYGAEGRDYGTFKYNSDGALQWLVRYNGSGQHEDNPISLVLDQAGNIIVSGYSAGAGTSYDYATVKYNTDGEQQWVARYNGTGNNVDIATSMALGQNGDILVTGYSPGSGTDYDYTTIKYDSAGVEKWVSRYNGEGNASDKAKQIVVDSNGNAYVTGGSYGSGTGIDFATVKYDAAGVEQWVARYNPKNRSYPRLKAEQP